jgi:hypothetical protein
MGDYAHAISCAVTGCYRFSRWKPHSVDAIAKLHERSSVSCSNNGELAIAWANCRWMRRADDVAFRVLAAGTRRTSARSGISARSIWPHWKDCSNT